MSIKIEVQCVCCGKKDFLTETQAEGLECQPVCSACFNPMVVISVEGRA
jgi:hypothetical protein